MAKKLNHTTVAVKNMKQVGSIAASSRFLTKRILRDIDFSKDLKVMELGAGNGVFTKGLLSQLTPSSKLYSFEINEHFLDDLNAIGDNRLSVHNTCASKLESFEELDFDVVVSSLPLALFKKPFKDDIFSGIKSKLKVNGMYLQYQYSLLDYRMIEKNFNNCKVGFCLLNVPPAFVYKAKLKEK